jgi:hypothetical protein
VFSNSKLPKTVVIYILLYAAIDSLPGCTFHCDQIVARLKAHNIVEQFDAKVNGKVS